MIFPALDLTPAKVTSKKTTAPQQLSVTEQSNKQKSAQSELSQDKDKARRHYRKLSVTRSDGNLRPYHNSDLAQRCLTDLSICGMEPPSTLPSDVLVMMCDTVRHWSVEVETLEIKTTDRLEAVCLLTKTCCQSARRCGTVGLDVDHAFHSLTQARLVVTTRDGW